MSNLRNAAHPSSDHPTTPRKRRLQKPIKETLCSADSGGGGAGGGPSKPDATAADGAELPPPAVRPRPR